jgi:diguanylate cyclase (GGDEF)-like protein
VALLRGQRRNPSGRNSAPYVNSGQPMTGWPDALTDSNPDRDPQAGTEALAESITAAARELSGAVAAHLWLATADGDLHRVMPGQQAIVAQRRRNDVALRAFREAMMVTSATRSRRLIAVPLLHAGRTWGVVELSMPSGSDEPTSAQTEMLRAWGRQAAKLIAAGPNGGRDPLTGFAGRPQLLLDSTSAVEMGTAGGRPVSLVVLAIDATGGRTPAAGSRDDLVRTVGAVLSDTVRTSDTAYRVGESTFAILLPGAPASAAASLAERLRQIVARRFIERGVTASFGVATCPDTADDHQRLIEAAESALYDAQRFGGNRAQAARPLADELALLQFRPGTPS